MKAVVYEKYGGVDDLHIKEVDQPIPGDHEVLVRVRAVSLNDWDWGKMDGSSLFNRLTSGFKKPKHPILGSDIAGIVEAVGKYVRRFQPGDAVYGDLSGTWGGLADYVCAHESKLAPKPASMTFEQAAAIPQAGMLAVQGLIDKGHMQAGQKILINGAGGGVGTFGLQLAKLKGIEVTVVDSGEKLEMLSELGAARTIDYTQEDFTKGVELYDLILDVKTNRPVSHYLRVLKPEGKYVTVGGSLSRLFQFLFAMPFIHLFTKKKIGIVVLKTNKDLPLMNELFEAGQLKPVIDGKYTLDETREAFRLFAKAGHKGKIVVSVP